jgi:hypothetical protein
LLFLAAIFFTGAFIAMMWSLWCNVRGMKTITSSRLNSPRLYKTSRIGSLVVWH